MKRYFNVLILVVVCVCSFFIYGDAIPINLMELRNCITARELPASENWLLPTMNGEYRLAKPPLPTWLTALAGMVVGDMHNLSALRFPAALMAAWMVFSLYFFAQLLFKNRQTAFMAAAIFATAYLSISVGRANSWDVYCHSFMMAAILVLWRIFHEKKPPLLLFVITGCLLGLSFFSKGPIAFYSLLLPFLLSYSYFFSWKKSIKNKVLGWGILFFIFLIISIFWPFYITFNLPTEGLQTANTEVTAWVSRNTRPIWYYLTFPLEMGIWVFGVLAMLYVPYARKCLKNELQTYHFLLFWLFGAIVLLSLVPEKKERYLFPALVPMALLAAQYFQYLIKSFKNNTYGKVETRFLLLNALVCMLSTMVAMGVFTWIYFQENLLHMSFVKWLLGMFVFVTVLLFLVQSYQQKKVFQMVMGAVLLMVTITFFYLPITAHFFKLEKKEPLVEAIQQMPDIKDFAWYHVGANIPFGLLWDSQRTIPKWDYLGNCSSLEKLPIVLFCEKKMAKKVYTDCNKHFFTKKLKATNNWHIFLIKKEQ